MRYRRVQWISGGLMLSLSCGCALMRQEQAGSPVPPTQKVSVQRMVIGQTVEGRPIECEVHGSGSETILILAGIHGTERAGTPLLRKLGDHLREHPKLVEERRVMLVPEVNPDGCSHQRRQNTHGVDLNRNFPARNWSDRRGHGQKALSEPESRALHSLIAEYQPHRILSLHQPMDCLDYDGPNEAMRLAQVMAKACDLRVKKIGGLDGSLGSWAGETIGIPIVTVEFPRETQDFDGDQMWERYGRMLLAAIQFEGSAARAEVSRSALP